MNTPRKAAAGIELETGDIVGYAPAESEGIATCPLSGFCAAQVVGITGIMDEPGRSGPVFVANLVVRSFHGVEHTRFGVAVLTELPGPNEPRPYAVPKWMLFARAVRVAGGADVAPGQVLADQLAAAEEAAHSVSGGIGNHG